MAKNGLNPALPQCSICSRGSLGWRDFVQLDSFSTHGKLKSNLSFHLHASNTYHLRILPARTLGHGWLVRVVQVKPSEQNIDSMLISDRWWYVPATVAYPFLVPMLVTLGMASLVRKSPILRVSLAQRSSNSSRGQTMQLSKF